MEPGQTPTSILQSPIVTTASTAEHAQATAERWFAARGWTPFDFQREVWQAYLAGESGLIHAATGTGKTMAASWGPWLDWLRQHNATQAKAPRLRVLWLTPMRALAADTEKSLREPIHDLGLTWTIERRTGDTSSSNRARQLKTPPSTLITTPESLSLLLTQPNTQSLFRNLDCAVVDEWHELMGNKRGVQTELALARLRQLRPALRIWGLSATLGNLDEARAALLGVDPEGSPRPCRLIQGHMPKEIVVDTLLPDTVERFPWAGHMGLKMLPKVVAAIEEGRTALVFTNTRNQAETWYQALLAERPDWTGKLALHHGSLAAETRQWVEDNLRDGALRCVVATSSLDLGVDFSPVDRVLQVGSPKGVARLLQRAGRSGHQPGATSRVTCVPAHAFELVEAAAARDAMTAGLIEGREPVDAPLDLLVQHLVTIALGPGFEPASLYEELRTTYAFRSLSPETFQWALDFVVHGGDALGAYPEYHRVALEPDGLYRVVDRFIAGRHRMSVGTIVSDASLTVRYKNGRSLGTIQESFISRLKPGNTFVFAGNKLEFINVREMTAWVKPARRLRGMVPAWSGMSLPISAELGASVRRKLAEARDGVYDGPELAAVRPVLELQRKWSALPAAGELLVEQIETGDGHHLFIYPFAGKLVHLGLAALFAYRLGRRRPLTFTLTANDYGFELLSAEPAPFVEAVADAAGPLFGAANLLSDIQASLNESEMAQRQFREIARVAGLIFQGFPGQPRKSRHLQASSSLLYEVFSKYDAGNLLLQQAHQEVLSRQLEQSRLLRTLEAMQRDQLLLVNPTRPTPLCFPLLVERLQAGTVSSESLADQVRRMTMWLEKEAG